MKIVLYDDYKPGLLKGDQVVDVSGVVTVGRTGQETIEGIINNWESLKPRLEQALSGGSGVPLSSVKLRAVIGYDNTWKRIEAGTKLCPVRKVRGRPSILPARDPTRSATAMGEVATPLASAIPSA